MQKTCFKCRHTKPLSEFYRHSRMADGHLNKCKSCTKCDARIHRVSKIDQVNKYDRERARLDHRKNDHRERQRQYRTKYPERQAAYNAVARAIKSGKLHKPSECEGCGNKASVQAHHEDYLRKLDVIWLCQKCHSQHHHVRDFVTGEWL